MDHKNSSSVNQRPRTVLQHFCQTVCQWALRVECHCIWQQTSTVWQRKELFCHVVKAFWTGSSELRRWRGHKPLLWSLFSLCVLTSTAQKLYVCVYVHVGVYKSQTELYAQIMKLDKTMWECECVCPTEPFPDHECKMKSVSLQWPL